MRKVVINHGKTWFITTLKHAIIVTNKHFIILNYFCHPVVLCLILEQPHISSYTFKIQNALFWRPIVNVGSLVLAFPSRVTDHVSQPIKEGTIINSTYCNVHCFRKQMRWLQFN